MSADEIERFERWLLDELPLDAEHVPDSETQAFDARLVAPYTTTNGLRIIGRTRLEAGTPIELKSCHVWISDNGSGQNRRRGTWQIAKGNHDGLEELGGVYCCVVLDGEKVLAGRLLAPSDLDSFVSSWTNGGWSEQRAHVSWRSVIGPESVQGGSTHAD